MSNPNKKVLVYNDSASTFELQWLHGQQHRKQHQQGVGRGRSRYGPWSRERSGLQEVTRLQCLSILDVIVAEVALVVLHLLRNTDQFGSGIVEQQIFIVVFCRVKKLELAAVSLCCPILVAHVF